jgi:hypothetical protein
MFPGTHLLVLDNIWHLKIEGENQLLNRLAP